MSSFLCFTSVNNTIYFAAIKDLTLLSATSHTLKLTWAPLHARACMLENITVVAVRPGQNRPSASCIVFKESLSNFCIIEGLVPNEVYTVRAFACTSSTSGCNGPEANILASTHPASKWGVHFYAIRCLAFVSFRELRRMLTYLNITDTKLGYTVASE